MTSARIGTFEPFEQSTALPLQPANTLAVRVGK